MERIPIPIAMLPQKSSSFSQATIREEKLGRNLSLGAIKLNEHIERVKKDAAEAAGDKKAAAGGGEGGPADGETPELPPYEEPDLAELSAEVEAYLASRDGDAPLSISEVTLDRFASAVEVEIAQSEGEEDKWALREDGEQPLLLAAIKRVVTLASVLTASGGGNGTEGAVRYTIGVHRVTGVLHRSMTFLEDELHALLEDPRLGKTSNASESGSASAKSMKRPPSFGQGGDPDRSVVPSTEGGTGGDDASQPFPPETVDHLRAMVDVMITAGYETECTQVFLVARRNALDATMQGLGYEKASIDDVVKMAWEGLESEIGTWIKAFRHIVNVGLSAERDLCVRVFAGRNAGLGRDIFADLARCAMLQMFNFTEAVAMTKRAAEKLFKVLDMYEAIRDGAPVVDAFISVHKTEAGENPDGNSSGAEALADLKAELASVRSRLGESAAAIFCDLESSIRADAGKQPVPGGAVHPLTRYLMNYLKYACEYKNTLEQVFREFHRPDADDAPGHDGESNPFAAQLMEVMELLHGNLEAKSRLYKDLALSSIFLMNNGRYMLQKIRGSPEINAVVGEAWARKRSTDLRQYHKNYQRETWGRVLNVLRDDGVITVKGHVQKPVLKERFKQFNAAMDEIQRTQGAWVVSDEQLQSELRVSIAAVVVPAYRSFLGRFAQHFTAGRQTEKYIKLSADDLEGIIEELFEGSAGSMTRRRN
ncbi:exocyst complex component EXO70B1-like [Hordeum vulgare]|uniref:Exocyst subunit Exo70 family protein n=1 Tax=Hordeum vulgare subsp. vulgare TaxID=112509 RepID=A0A8I6XAN7_HORVV|nr:exocyst complex component EXO70B1-like [Hordeum vulgare subsp. vulgare]KAE8792715.1 exocyst complex component EXO70B1-like [Hordeum vulgare]